jgi:undecaprenyl-diphosphatase
VSRFGFARLRACVKWGWPLIVGLILTSFALAVFVGLADEVLEREAIFFDETILTALADLASPPLTRFMLLVTDSAADVFLVPVMLVLLVVWWRKRRADWVALFVSVAGAFALNLIAKNLFGRARPDLFPHLQDVGGYSFPSGHSQAAMAFYPVLAYLVARRVNPKWRPLIYVVAGVWVVLVGLSRNYLSVHYPSDVLAAFAVTLPWVAAVIFVHRCYAPALEVTPSAAN